ncbi:hypothetical protein [Pyxidicoccus xibeiensis]|uniref:hypothetical protein n=1 Tax=Pyxidicoccus xibeiensis TaxID=2906759 RepID=UPI0020A79C83|nr:hypothetical protein [Pyxidicoccus xibeiensis]MCP3136550.1 hypothetical protein [Pyxidicoccus xibeiensis]
MSSNTFALLCCAALLVMTSGCASSATGGVALRPDGAPGPQDCPEKAREVMGYLGLHVGDAALAQLDANQPLTPPITLYDGPIESVLEDDLGIIEAPSRLYGQVWTSGPILVIRYYEAQRLDGGKRLPICAVARLGSGELRKRPESKPGTAIIDSSRAGVFIVDGFR